MTEQKTDIIQLLEKIDSEADLISTIPPQIIEKLGGGDTGMKRFLMLLKGFGVPAPGISTSKMTFSKLIPFDESGEYLGDEVAENMFQAALDLDIVAIDPNDDTRMIPNKDLERHLKRIYGQGFYRM